MFIYIFWQELWSMYGNDASNKIGLGIPLSVVPHPTIYKGVKQLYILQLITIFVRVKNMYN